MRRLNLTEWLNFCARYSYTYLRDTNFARPCVSTYFIRLSIHVCKMSTSCFKRGKSNNRMSSCRSNNETLLLHYCSWPLNDVSVEGVCCLFCTVAVSCNAGWLAFESCSRRFPTQCSVNSTWLNHLSGRTSRPWFASCYMLFSSVYKLYVVCERTLSICVSASDSHRLVDSSIAIVL